MNNISQDFFVNSLSLDRIIDIDKNERFVLDGLQLLSMIELLKLCEEKILDLIHDSHTRSSVRNTNIFKEFNNAEYYNVNIKDIVSTINLHSSNIDNINLNIDKYKKSTKKNVFLFDIDIPSKIFAGELINDFHLKIKNLGFDGIDSSDFLRISIFNKSLNEKSNLDVNMNITNSVIGDSSKVKISGLIAPSREYEYTFRFEFISSNELIYFREIKGVDILRR